jgi:hypothetical protein
MGDVNFIDLPGTPEKVVGMIKMAASNAAHLAGLLKRKSCVGVPSRSSLLPPGLMHVAQKCTAVLGTCIKTKTLKRVA